MSFSANVKEELEKLISRGRHCQMAEAAAIISLLGKVKNDGNGHDFIQVSSENIAIIRKLFTLLKKAFKIKVVVEVRKQMYGKKTPIYAIKIPYHEEFYQKCIAPDLMHSCCKRAYIRGAFLSSGSIADPLKSYHLEIVTNSLERAEMIEKTINSFQVEGKTIQRKRNFVVYLKEGSQIVELLNVMEAHNALMELENVRILKDVRNRVNRKVNCETANITKTVSASVKQMQDIELLRTKLGLDNLPPNLEEMARVRVEYPDVALKELGELLNPPVGKSGVNHRLRKLSNMAEELRD
jgi:DNA-binding protein WhiA